MSESLYPENSRDIVQRRKELAPDALAAWSAFSSQVFSDGALPEKIKHLIAVAVAHTTQCPYCIKGHTTKASKTGATDEEIMEAIWVAAEMRSGGAVAHSTLAIDTLNHLHDHS